MSEAARGGPAASGAPERLARAAVVCLCVAMPVTMAIANKSAPALLGAGAALALMSLALAGGLADAARRLKILLLRPHALSLIACGVLCAASLAWSIDTAMTLRGFIEGAPVALCAVAFAACAPAVTRRRDMLLLAAGLALAAGLILFENYSGEALHRLVGARAMDIEEKRSALFIGALLWPALAVFAAKTRYGPAAALFGAAVLAAAAGHSGAALFGLGAGGVVYGLALIGPRFTLGLTALCAAAALLSAPWQGAGLARVMTPNMEAVLAQVHAAHRIAIWSEFGRRIWEEPLRGRGFNTSQSLYRAAVAQTDAQADRLIEKIHPHNIYIQIWTELGALGVAFAGLFGAALYRAMLSLPRSALAPRLALTAYVAAVGLVSHSLWQPWWLAAIAASCIFMRMGAAETPEIKEARL